MRILLVDDDPIFLAITSRILTRYGHLVTAMPDGAAALDQLRDAAAAGEPFQLVLSDWEMPGLTGPELCKAARALFGRDRLYIILLTGRGESARLDGLHAGADDFLSKPIETADLQGSIRAAELILAPTVPKRRAV